MKKISAVLFSIIVTSLFLSCDNEVTTISDWEDITVVYGLLNQNDSITYLKITKAFLGEGNALIFAQEPDSSQYDVKLDVKIEEYNNGKYVREFVFDTTTVYDKEEGVFFAPRQTVYQAVTHQQLNDRSRYKLVVHNPTNGETITAETPLVHSDLEISKPIINNAARPTINITDDDYTKAVELISTVNGRRYGVYVTFYYQELLEGNPNPINKNIVWRAFPVMKATTADGGEKLGFDFVNKTFWKWINDNVPYTDAEMENSVLERYADQVVFTFEVAEDQFNTYMEVYEPSVSLIQDRPVFTNINNGIGLFAARFSKERAFYLSEISSNILWDDYYELKFVNPVN
ncbi:MAG: hypothetical protein PHU97_06075 [Bacteroidales bacterium]|nr:hypothetical protein [Bacteroidales bacterium]MDD3010868.1 hypothetical protein [Bacteroidales bacterium]